MTDERHVYPPARHLLRDLRILILRDARDVIARLETNPKIADANGRPRVGVLATLVDVIAGEMAIRCVLPNWTATSDLGIHVGECPETGSIEAIPRVLRSGRQRVVLETQLRGGPEARPFGIAHVGFTVLPARTALQSGDHWAQTPEVRTEFGLPDSGFERPLLERLGFEARSPAIAHLGKVSDYLRNSLGALQGGAVAILLEASAEHFAAAEIGAAVRVRSLSIHYLKLARVGPIRAESTGIARTKAGILVRVSLFDEGAADILLSVATIQVDEVDTVA